MSVQLTTSITPPTTTMVQVTTAQPNTQVTTSTQPILTSPTGVNRPSPSMWFTAEIQQMMHGLGDCRKPYPESATLVESIVHRQMTSLLLQAEEVAKQRNARFIGLEDFVFLLRKNKVKLVRLLRYLEVKDLRQSVKGTVGGDDEEGGDPDASAKHFKKRKKMCYDFVQAIDQTGELLSLFENDMIDDVKSERLLRAELQTRTMDRQQYLDYAESRQASFTPKYKTQKFKDWLVAGLHLDVKPNPHAVEVLSYLAYETVAQVVELALIVKRDASSIVNDPFQSALPTICLSNDPSLNPLSAAPPTPGVTKSPSRASSPLSSPPATPTTPSGGLMSSSGLNTSSGSAMSSSSKSKSKKKKKGGNLDSKNLSTSQAIQPSEIREAVRRFSGPMGPFDDFTKSPLLTPSKRHLAL